MFPLPKGKPEFSKLEESILQYWKENKTFEKSVESRPAENPYRFYDGPPFITGTPHYGSLLSSIIKDVVPRYQTMKGKRVERVWGWDCHGLPIEQKVQKKLGLESNKEIEESAGGIQGFIDECYAYTRDTSAEWSWYIDHIGRWVDMDNAYRTMDQDYMESVMWVFRQIWEKGYIYEGKRVSWYSWKLSTPISNFEIAMDDSYQDVQDPAITVKFPLKDIKTGSSFVIQDEEGKLLMIKNKKDGLWRFPGGNVEPGETFHTAASRELLEETGVSCELREYCSAYVGYRGGFYECRGYRGMVSVGQKIVLEEDKYSEYEYFSLDALPVRSEIHRMEHDWIDFLTGVREPVIVPEIPESRTVNILAWTTTPWTMPMHMALAVNRDLQYVAVYHAEEIYIVAASRVETVFKGKGNHQVLCMIPGDELVGLSYKAPFDFYQGKPSPPVKGGAEGGGLLQNPSEIDAKQGGKFTYTEEGRLRYVLAVIKNEKGDVLMLQNIKHGLNWQCPGGKIDAGEAPEEALKREVYEELGVDVEVGKHLGNFHCQTEDDTYWQGEYYEVTYTGTLEIKEPHKHAQMQWARIVPDSTKKPGFHLDFVSGEQVLDEEKLAHVYDANALFGFTNKVSTGKIPPAPLSQGGMFANSFKIYHADFVTDTDGTGIAHEAPEFGDVDFQLAKEKGIHITSAIDEAGKYTAEVPDYQGVLYLDAIDPITERMKTEGTLFKKEGITHRVPYCPRSNTPLIQKAQKSWFIDIQRIKSELIAQNENINWFPEHFKHGRFLKSLESAPDWCVSRSRFWGTPMPVWQSTDGSERVVIDSREELYQRNKPLGQITKLVVLRHAQSEANVAKMYNDDGLSPLSEKGKQQAEELVEKLKKEGVEVIISSPFLRTIQTITPFAEASGISIETMEELRETGHGDIANKPSDTDVAQEAREHFNAHPDNKFGKTGESQNDMRARARVVIDLIQKKYPGKTVAIVSHGYPVKYFLAEAGVKPLGRKVVNAEPFTIYLDNNTGKEINLHRPYIDRIYVPGTSPLTPLPRGRGEGDGGVGVRFPEGRAGEEVHSLKTPKKVLGVHGYNHYGNVVDFFEKTKEALAQEGVHMDAPFFESGESVDYKNWEKVFDSLDIASYDTWITHSMGAKTARQYIVSHGIHVKKMILVAPRYEMSDRPAMEKAEKEQLTHTFEELREFVDELIVINSEDDRIPVTSGKKIAEATGGKLITINGAGHFNVTYSPFITGMILHGMPLRRIPEVLDVWMDSASMPYAQVHYPFSFGEDSSILEATTESEREMCFEFFKKLWKEEFAIDFDNAKRTIEEIRTDFWKSKVFYLKKDDTLVSSIQVSAQTVANDHVPMGGMCMGRVGTLESYRKQGFGSRLIKKALQYVASLGIKEMYTNAEIKNIEYYQGFGFESVQDTPENKGNTSSVYMKKVFTPEEMQSSQSLVFPADFIAEYTGQIRAWFYVMHTIGVLVKGSPAFKNVAVTGVINGTDGRKMSKSYGNYPDPRATIEKYGADAIRFYLMGGTLMKGEDMTFSEAGIQESIKRVLLPLWNAYTFFATYANIDGWEPEVNSKLGTVNGQEGSKKTAVNGKQELPVYSLPSTVYSTKKTHELDTWIISRLHTLVQDVTASMDSYDLQKTCDAIMLFLDGLNNWYIRRNRRRFWRSELDADKKSAYETLHEVLVTLTKLLAPICPFISEYLYGCLIKNNSDKAPLSRGDAGKAEGFNEGKNPPIEIGITPPLDRGATDAFSVHLCDFPEANKSLINEAVNQKMTDLQNLTNLGLAIRGREKLRVRQPLRAATITLELDDSARETLAEELNVKEIHTVADVSEYVTITYSPDAKKIGATERKMWMKTIIADAKAGKGTLTLEGTLELAVPEAPDGKVILAADEFEAVYTPKAGSTIAFAGSSGYVIGLDTTLDEELTIEGYSRDLIRGIQDARKELGFQVTDRLQLSLTSESPFLAQVLATHQAMIEKETLTQLQTGNSKLETPRELEIDEGFVIQLALVK